MYNETWLAAYDIFPKVDGMGIERKVYSFRLEEELVEKLKNISAEQNRSLSNFIETILKEYANQYSNGSSYIDSNLTGMPKS